MCVVKVMNWIPSCIYVELAMLHILPIVETH